MGAGQNFPVARRAAEDPSIDNEEQLHHFLNNLCRIHEINLSALGSGGDTAYLRMSRGFCEHYGIHHCCMRTRGKCIGCDKNKSAGGAEQLAMVVRYEYDQHSFNPRCIEGYCSRRGG